MELLQGLGIGLLLTVMIGPITFTILDSSLSSGWIAGVVAAVGMWISDILYIGAVYYGGREVISAVQQEGIGTWVPVVAGLVLAGIGVALWFKRHDVRDPSRAQLKSFNRLSGHFIRGFLVNTFSPFTIGFWPTLVLTRVIDGGMSHLTAMLFFTGIMTSLVCGDTLKSIFAEWIRRRLSDKYIMWSRTGFAVIFVGIGLFLIGRAILSFT